MNDVPLAAVRARIRRDSLLRALLGLALGGLVLVVYFHLVGVARVRGLLLAVTPRYLAALLLLGLVPFVLWGGGLWLVLARLGRPVRSWNAVLLFVASSFLNSVTPFGQVGGDPVTAVLFGRAIGTDFETGLAAIGSVNAFNRVATVVLGLLGVGYLGSGVVAGVALVESAVLVAVLAVAIVVALVAGWRQRNRLVSLLADALAPLSRVASKALPGVDLPSREELAHRGHRFVGAIARLAADPRRLGVVFGLSLAGQLAVAATLWVALAALGFEASFAVVLLVIPVAKLSGLSPTPGGFGAAQTLLAALLVGATGIGAPLAAAAVLLYRASAFWFPSLLGGLVTGWYVVVGPSGVAGRGTAADGRVRADDTDWQERSATNGQDRSGPPGDE